MSGEISVSEFAADVEDVVTMVTIYQTAAGNIPRKALLVFR